MAHYGDGPTQVRVLESAGLVNEMSLGIWNSRRRPWRIKRSGADVI